MSYRIPLPTKTKRMSSVRIIPSSNITRGIPMSPLYSNRSSGLTSLTRPYVSRVGTKATPDTFRESLPSSVTRSIIPAILGTPSIPATTASMGGGAIAQAPAPTSGLGEVTTQLGGGLTNIGSSISKTATDYLPLAIKVVIGVIVIKIALWLVRGGGK